MLKRAGLLIMGVSFLATGSCLAGGDPDIKPEEVGASTPNGAATATAGAGSNAGNSASASCLLYTSPSPRDLSTSRMPSSA